MMRMMLASVALVMGAQDARALDWSYTLRAKSDVVSQALSFGVQAGATDSFDFGGIDGLLPPMAPGTPSRMYLWNMGDSTPLLAQMERDMRAPSADTLYWVVRTYAAPDSEPTVHLDTLQSREHHGGALEYGVAPYNESPITWTRFDMTVDVPVPMPSAFHIRYLPGVGIEPSASLPNPRAATPRLCVSPNPASTWVRASPSDARVASYEWVALDGRVIAHASRAERLSTRALATGVYVLRALDADRHVLATGSVTIVR